MTANRRDFLKSSLAGAGLVGWSFGAPMFLSRTAAAVPSAGKHGAKDTILVVIELNGGNDGLNTVIPFKDAEYAKLRPTLRQPQGQIKKINDELGLHPSLTGLADLLHDNALCVVQGVGYPNPNQSHFRSMDIWQTASLAENVSEGWLGKALKGLPGAPSFHLKSNNEPSPLALDGAPARVPSIKTLEEFQLQLAAASGADKKEQRDLIEGAARSNGGPNLLDFVQRTASNTYASSRRLQEIGKNYQPKATYPNTPLAGRLKLAAQLIDAGLGARLFYAAHGNFDTHATQAPSHANLLTQLSEAVTAFFKDVAARGHRDRVLVMTFSEFGRRAKENGSRGTDHGSAAPMFLIGGKVKPGPVGEHPSLTKLEFGNLKHHTDFRQVYAAVLDKWLGVSSKDVLGAGFKHAEVFKS
ncbi:MAG TPA: DUF1501 domain-containing protein [Gemmataceae bacterium]|nr:DUF1501 domain-containing protein [Gemmataceae bacterium]